MASLYVTEFSGIGYSGALLPQAPPVAVQALALTSDASTGAAFNSRTQLIEVNADSACFVTVGTTVIPSSTTAWRLAAGANRIYGVQAGQVVRAIATS